MTFGGIVRILGPRFCTAPLFCMAHPAPMQKDWTTPSSQSYKELKILKLIHTIAGMTRTGMSLGRLEPCEGKLSRASRLRLPGATTPFEIRTHQNNEKQGTA